MNAGLDLGKKHAPTGYHKTEKSRSRGLDTKPLKKNTVFGYIFKESQIFDRRKCFLKPRLYKNSFFENSQKCNGSPKRSVTFSVFFVISNVHSFFSNLYWPGGLVMEYTSCVLLPEFLPLPLVLLRRLLSGSWVGRSHCLADLV